MSGGGGLGGLENLVSGGGRLGGLENLVGVGVGGWGNSIRHDSTFHFFFVF